MPGGPIARLLARRQSSTSCDTYTIARAVDNSRASIASGTSAFEKRGKQAVSIFAAALLAKCKRRSEKAEDSCIWQFGIDGADEFFAALAGFGAVFVQRVRCAARVKGRICPELVRPVLLGIKHQADAMARLRDARQRFHVVGDRIPVGIEEIDIARLRQNRDEIVGEFLELCRGQIIDAVLNIRGVEYPAGKGIAQRKPGLPGVAGFEGPMITPSNGRFSICARART